MFNANAQKRIFDSAQRAYDNQAPRENPEPQFDDDDLTEMAIMLIEKCELSSAAYEQLHAVLLKCDLIMREAAASLAKIKQREMEEMKLNAEIEAGRRLI